MLGAARCLPAAVLGIPSAGHTASQWRLAARLGKWHALLLLPLTVLELPPSMPCLVRLAIQVVIAGKGRVVTLRRRVVEARARQLLFRLHR